MLAGMAVFLYRCRRRKSSEQQSRGSWRHMDPADGNGPGGTPLSFKKSNSRYADSHHIV